jgi:translocation and assembly module TamA
MLQRFFMGCFACSLLAMSVAPAQEDGIEYRVRFEGVTDGKLLSVLQGVSDTLSMRDSHPQNLLQLRRRASRDVDMFGKALRAEGYYESTVSFRLDSDDDGRYVLFQVDPGPLYHYHETAIELVGAGKPKVLLPSLEKLGLRPNDPAKSAPVVNAEAALLKEMKERGYPFVSVAERVTTVDHATHTMDVTYRLAPGPRALFGPVHVTGLDRVKEQVVKAEVPWKADDIYQESVLEKFRKRLYETNLFSVVRLQPAAALDPDGKLPIEVTVTERKPRTLWAGAEYYTDEGLGTRIGWEHRNLEGLGRRLRIEGLVGETHLEAKSEYRIRHFARDEQTLRLGLEVGQYSPDAFRTRRVRASAIIDRKLRDDLTASVGVALKISQVEQLADTDSFQLVSLPTELTWDRSNAPLDPTKGFRLSGRVEPFTDVYGGDTTFLRSSVIGTWYWPWLPEGKLSLATRAKIGSIVGETTARIPADERFYSGGGGSVRGYAFQTVGPLVNDDPTGGRSVFESSAELRYRFSETFGGVAFVDAGSAFETTTPNFNHDILYGAGVGLRYFSPIGPMRLDFAVPLDRREGIDDSFQVYISIGQAF